MSKAVARHETDPSSGLDSKLWSLLRKAARVSFPGSPLPRIGQVIAEKYRIEGRIGRGGMGAVFRASHLLSEKPVAIKWMLGAADDESARQRFLREARLTGRIQHPNVVDVYDVSQDGQCLFLVMELLEGEALRARLERGPLPVSEVIDLLLPAMRGVAAAHRAGVIHRDLKPDNIFLCDASDGTAPQAKVLDFGISALSEEPNDDLQLAEEDCVVGTPSYMSPEQLIDGGTPDVRSDVYAFGVILYEALTGKLPFTADSFPNLVEAVASQRPQPPLDVRPELPGRLGRIVMRALAKQREDRYPDIDSMIAELAPFARNRRGSRTRSRTSGLPRWVLACTFGVFILAASLLAQSAATHGQTLARQSSCAAR